MKCLRLVMKKIEHSIYINITRYMKCLAIGMNPNYVLSEDERKRRFKKRKNSTTEEPARVESLMLVTPSVTAPTGEEQIKNEIVKNEIIQETVLRNVDETGLFKKPYQRHASSDGDHRGNTIPPLDFQIGRKHVKDSVPLQTNYFEQMIETRRGSFSPPDNIQSCLPLPPDKTQMRSSIIKKTGNIFYNTNSGSHIANYTKQPQLKTFKDEAVHTFNEEINSLINFNAFSLNSSNQNDKIKFKDPRAYEVDSSSESEDDILPQI